MCLAIPFEIKEISGNEAVCDRDGISRNVRIDLIKDPKPGDFILVHAGFAIEKINKRQAKENLEAAKELQEVLEIIKAEQKT